VLLKASAYSGDDIEQLINSTTANYQTTEDEILSNYIPMLCGGIVALVTIPSNVIFNILGNRALEVMNGIFNERWLEEERHINFMFDNFMEDNIDFS
jgi:hypothetical protein